MARIDLDLIRALSRRDARERSKLFFVEGERFVIAALTTRTVVERVVLVRERRLTPTLAKLVDRRRDVLEVGRDEFEALSSSREPSGVGAVVRMPEPGLPDRPKRGPWLGFEVVRSYGNLGSAIRSAVAFDAGGVGAPGR